jgi:hypothetical protein
LADDEITKIIEEDSKKKEVKREVREEKEEVSVEEPEVNGESLLKEEERPLAEKKKEKVLGNGFVINVKDYLSRKDIEVLHVVAEKRWNLKQRFGFIRIWGRQAYYLIAKD